MKQMNASEKEQPVTFISRSSFTITYRQPNFKCILISLSFSQKLRKKVSCFRSFSHSTYLFTWFFWFVLFNFIQHTDKARTFWEAHKIWKKSFSWFGRFLSKCTNHEEDFSKFCMLLKKSELYCTVTKVMKFSGLGSSRFLIKNKF